MSIAFDEIIEQYGDRIVEETKKSYAELVERGMVLKKEPSGKLRLLYNRSWWGTPQRLILPIPDSKRCNKRNRNVGKNIAIIHTHLGTPLHSLTDMLNFAYNHDLSWLGTATMDRKTGTVLVRAVKVNTLIPRLIPAVVAYLENELNYKYGIPTGPRVEIREARIPL